MIKTRFILIEHRHIIRAGVRGLIESVPGFSIVAEYGDVAATTGSKLPEADIVITNIGDARDEVISMISTLKKRTPSPKVLVMTSHRDHDTVKSLFQAGADGYLLKDDAEDGLFGAIKKLRNNDTFCSRQASESLLNEYATKKIIPQHVTISEREKEIIGLISHGYNNKEIAAKMFLATKTIESLRAGILQKLEAKNTAEMVRLAFEFKLIG